MSHSTHSSEAAPASRSASHRVLRRVLGATAVAGVFGVAMLSGPAAHAYMDPGSGSYLFQILIGLLMTGALSVRLFWRRVVSVFKRGPSDPGAAEAAPSESRSSKE